MLTPQVARHAAQGMGDVGVATVPSLSSRSQASTVSSGPDPEFAHCEGNTRDLAELVPSVRPGLIFRSSQFYTPELRAVLDIRSVLDLRQSKKKCMQPCRVAMEFVRPDWLMMRSQNIARHLAGGVPRCPNCEDLLRAEGEQTGMHNSPKVYHVDMCTGTLKCKVFTSVPSATAATALGHALTMRSPSAVIADAIADPSKLGYGKLYILFLEHSKRQIANAFAVLADPESYPILVHCIHGKDRTGIIVMLLLSVCGVPAETIVSEYMVTALSVEAWEGGAMPPLEPHLCSKRILSVEREYMADAIKHIDERYGSVQRYLESCGVCESVQQSVRDLLLME